jgi:hypothetical protein
MNMSGTNSSASKGDQGAGETPTPNGREVDENGNPVLPWAFIDCDTDDLVVLVGEFFVEECAGVEWSHTK